MLLKVATLESGLTNKRSENEYHMGPLSGGRNFFFLATTRSVIFCPACPPAQSKRQRLRETGKVALTNFLSAQRTTQEIFMATF